MKSQTGIEGLGRTRAMVAALTFAGLMALPTPQASAQVLQCSASLDVDVHYCLDDADIGFPGQSCNPLQMGDGDTVTVTIEVSNDSQHNPPAPPPPDPPAGQLQVGQTFKVFYACSASTCSAGQELPGWFTFVAVDYAEPGVSFADDGNGYSGTVTITAPVVYLEADAAPRKILRIRTTANLPPAIEGSTVFARAEGSDANLRRRLRRSQRLRPAEHDDDRHRRQHDVPARRHLDPDAFGLAAAAQRQPVSDGRRS